MSDLFSASIREKLWHKMRQDLATYIPEIAQNELLMCCACGRFLPQDCFDLEHLIPQQSLKQDPADVRVNPDTPKNVRSGNLLLCKKSLVLKGQKVYNNGCNSWKGRFFDKPISELVSEMTKQSVPVTSLHTIAALSLSYLAMVAEFGYVVVLMQSGVLLRRQFFSPYKFLRDLPHRHQVMLCGSMPVSSDAQIWTKPFSFGFNSPGCCTVAARNFAINLPISRDPRMPIARHLRIAPIKFKMRPNYETFFE